ncbi:protein GOLM2-like isoform X8 [Palaemon carinicauda]|uniref:protein GOLM2-like isoform X8 n=1 Tax=Palaemon carinicauda TaxID=392227 RepID=UPI0035B5C05F
MIRRGTGRTPPYILVGLLLIIVILGFNYWTLSSQNADLSQELEKLQSEIKISAMKQEQSEKKNSALQETVHEMDGLSNRLKKEIQDDKDALKASNIEVQKLRYEITTLKNKAAKMQEQISSLIQQAEDCEVDLSKAKETNGHLTQERDDAVEAIAEKDSMINSLKRQLEQEKARSDAFNISVKDLTLKLTEANNELTQCREGMKTSALENAAKLKKAQDEAAAARREKMAIAMPKIEPGMMNIPDIEHKEPYVGPGQLGYISRGAVHTRDLGIQGIKFHRELQILPRDPPNLPRKKPRFSVADIARENAAPQNNNNINGENFNGGVLAPPQSIGQVNPPLDGNNNADNHLAAPGVPVMERPAAPGEGNKPIQAPIHPGDVDGPGPQNDVLAPPPQHLQDNLDAAIDEEEKIVEDMMDDQDEEGNEIKQNHEVNDIDNIHEERKEMLKNENVGALEVPQPFQADSFNHQEMNVDDVGNQGNYYDTNLENKIRNFGRPPDLH